MDFRTQHCASVPLPAVRPGHITKVFLRLLLQEEHKENSSHNSFRARFTLGIPLSSKLSNFNKISRDKSFQGTKDLAQMAAITGALTQKTDRQAKLFTG